MGRTRRAGRKYQLAKLARSIHYVARAHAAPLGTTEHISTRDVERPVNHADRARAAPASPEDVYTLVTIDVPAPSRPVTTEERILRASSSPYTTYTRLPWILRPIQYVPALPRLEDICIEDPRYGGYARLRAHILRTYY